MQKFCLALPSKLLALSDHDPGATKKHQGEKTMTDIVIHIWSCDNCHKISFLPKIVLDHSIPHYHRGQNKIHLCASCTSQGLIICPLCNTIHLSFVPCYGPAPTCQLDKVLP
jgi:hypothetical protein